jgi:hypothetical protein
MSFLQFIGAEGCAFNSRSGFPVGNQERGAGPSAGAVNGISATLVFIKMSFLALPSPSMDLPGFGLEAAALPSLEVAQSPAKAVSDGVA